MLWTAEQLHAVLMERTKKQIVLKLNHNKTNMLSVCDGRDSALRLSLHHMFLNATENVLDALCRFLCGRYTAKARRTLQDFINTCLQSLDYSATVPRHKLCVQGTVYNLQEVFDRINAEYFETPLSLHLTWYGQRRSSSSRYRATLGQYDGLYRLIKIHRCMDHSEIPSFFMDFVLFHEMLHHVIPPAVDEKGRTRYHGKEFKAREREFKQYREAKAWEEAHKERFFLQ